MRNWSRFIASDRGRIAKLRAGLLDLVAQQRRLFKIFLIHGFGEFLLQTLEPFAKVPILLQRERNFADVTNAVVHRFKETFQPIGEGRITFGTAKPPSLLKIRLSEAALGTF